jgi:hypothetical protein
MTSHFISERKPLAYSNMFLTVTRIFVEANRYGKDVKLVYKSAPSVLLFRCSFVLPSSFQKLHPSSTVRTLHYSTSYITYTQGIFLCCLETVISSPSVVFKGSVIITMGSVSICRCPDDSSCLFVCICHSDAHARSQSIAQPECYQPLRLSSNTWSA